MLIVGHTVRKNPFRLQHKKIQYSHTKIKLCLKKYWEYVFIKIEKVADSVQLLLKKAIYDPTFSGLWMTI